MTFSIRPILTATLIAGSLLAHANVCQAGPILDWLFSRCRAKQQPTVVTNYAPYVAGVAGCNTCNPCNACSTCPTTTTAYACQPAPQVQVNYAPQTSYKFGWLQVPVTTYKPETTVDPCTGCSVVSMKPCTSYTWRLSRIPYTTYSPTFSTAAAPTTVSYAPSTGACCGAQTLGSAPATSYYGGSSYSAPASYSAPTTYSAPATMGSPASMAPAIGSSGCSSCGQSAGSTSYYPSTPSTSYYPSTPSSGGYSYPVSPETSGSVSAGSSSGGSAADVAPSIGGSSNFGSMDSGQSGASLGGSASGDSVIQGGGASTAGMRTETRPPQPITRHSNLQPVPDPDAHLRSQPAQDNSDLNAPAKSGAPRLLDPRDRTAANLIRPAVFVQPASWPELNAPNVVDEPEVREEEPRSELRLEPAELQPAITSARSLEAAPQLQRVDRFTAPVQREPAAPQYRAPQPQPRVRPAAPAEPAWDDSGWQSLN